MNKVKKSSIILIDIIRMFSFFFRYLFLNKIYFSWEDTTKTTQATTVPPGATKPVTTTWEQHWSKLDDGSGRLVLFFLQLLFSNKFFF